MDAAFLEEWLASEGWPKEARAELAREYEERPATPVELRGGAAPLMPTIAAAAADLLANPRPVLCLDTCELLMAVQCLPQRHVVHVEALARIHTFLAANPDHLLVVLTDLVPHEWGQNLAEVQQKAGRFLVQADEDSTLVHGAWSHLGRPLGSTPSAYAATALVNELTALPRR